MTSEELKSGGCLAHWKNDVRKIISFGIGTCSPSKLQEAMVLLFKKSYELAEMYEEKRKVKRMKELCFNLRGFLLHCHFRASNMCKVMSSPTYEELVVAILSIIIKLEIAIVLSNDGRSAQSMRKLVQDFFLYLGHKPVQMWDVFLRSSKCCKRHSFLNILFQRVHDAVPKKISSPESYIKYLLVMKLWRKCLETAEEQEKIASLASKVRISGKRFSKWIQSLPVEFPLSFPADISERVMVKKIVCDKMKKRIFQGLKDILLCSVKMPADHRMENDTNSLSEVLPSLVISEDSPSEAAVSIGEKLDGILLHKSLDDAISNIHCSSKLQPVKGVSKDHKKRRRSVNGVHENHIAKKKKILRLHENYDEKLLTSHGNTLNSSHGIRSKDISRNLFVTERALRRRKRESTPKTQTDDLIVVENIHHKSSLSYKMNSSKEDVVVSKKRKTFSTLSKEGSIDQSCQLSEENVSVNRSYENGKVAQDVDKFLATTLTDARDSGSSPAIESVKNLEANSSEGQEHEQNRNSGKSQEKRRQKLSLKHSEKIQLDGQNTKLKNFNPELSINGVAATCLKNKKRKLSCIVNDEIGDNLGQGNEETAFEKDYSESEQNIRQIAAPPTNLEDPVNCDNAEATMGEERSNSDESHLNVHMAGKCRQQLLQNSKEKVDPLNNPKNKLKKCNQTLDLYGFKPIHPNNRRRGLSSNLIEGLGDRSFPINGETSFVDRNHEREKTLQGVNKVSAVPARGVDKTSQGVQKVYTVKCTQKLQKKVLSTLPKDVGKTSQEVEKGLASPERDVGKTSEGVEKCITASTRDVEETLQEVEKVSAAPVRVVEKTLPEVEKVSATPVRVVEETLQEVEKVSATPVRVVEETTKGVKKVHNVRCIQTSQQKVSENVEPSANHKKEKNFKNKLSLKNRNENVETSSLSSCSRQKTYSKQKELCFSNSRTAAKSRLFDEISINQASVVQDESVATTTTVAVSAADVESDMRKENNCEAFPEGEGNKHKNAKQTVICGVQTSEITPNLGEVAEQAVLGASDEHQTENTAVLEYQNHAVQSQNNSDGVCENFEAAENVSVIRESSDQATQNDSENSVNLSLPTLEDIEICDEEESVDYETECQDDTDKEKLVDCVVTPASSFTTCNATMGFTKMQKYVFGKNASVKNWSDVNILLPVNNCSDQSTNTFGEVCHSANIYCSKEFPVMQNANLENQSAITPRSSVVLRTGSQKRTPSICLNQNLSEQLLEVYGMNVAAIPGRTKVFRVSARFSDNALNEKILSKLSVPVPMSLCRKVLDFDDHTYNDPCILLGDSEHDNNTAPLLKLSVDQACQTVLKSKDIARLTPTIMRKRKNNTCKKTTESKNYSSAVVTKLSKLTINSPKLSAVDFSSPFNSSSPQSEEGGNEHVYTCRSNSRYDLRGKLKTPKKYSK